MIEFNQNIRQLGMPRRIAGQTVSEDWVIESRYFSTFSFNDEARITIVPDRQGDESLLVEQKYTENFYTSKAPFNVWERYASVSVVPNRYTFSSSPSTIYWFPVGNYITNSPQSPILSTGNPPVVVPLPTLTTQINLGKVPGCFVLGDQDLIDNLIATSGGTNLSLERNKVVVVTSESLDLEIPESAIDSGLVLTESTFIGFRLPEQEPISVPVTLGLLDVPREVNRDFESATIRERLNWHSRLGLFQDDVYLTVQGEDAIYGKGQQIYPNWD